MFAIITGFFAVVIGVNITMAVLATGSWTGLVVKNSYVASQNYNAVLEDARTQRARGWTSALDYTDGRLHLVLRHQDKTAVSGARVDVKLSRPVGTEQDRSITLVEHLPGEYELLEPLEPGAWDMEVQAFDLQATSYKQVFRLVIRQKGGS